MWSTDTPGTGPQNGEQPQVIHGGQAFIQGAAGGVLGMEAVQLDFRPRTAFIRAASKVWAMDMTSPVAFIWEPNFRLAPWNLSKGHLGNFTTT